MTYLILNSLSFFRCLTLVLRIVFCLLLHTFHFLGFLFQSLFLTFFLFDVVCLLRAVRPGSSSARIAGLLLTYCSQFLCSVFGQLSDWSLFSCSSRRKLVEVCRCRQNFCRWSWCMTMILRSDFFHARHELKTAPLVVIP